MRMRELVVEKPYLHLPIRADGQRQYMKISADGQPVREYYLALATNAPDYYSPLYVGDWMGRTLRLSSDEEMPLAAILSGDAPSSDNPLYPDLYREKLRPQFHFSPLRGWMNDPNGLVYADGKYHLYFQHNPYGPLHGGVNIHWGHAVSEDCIHWREMRDGISPWDSVTHIASGNAIQLENGDIVAAFTALGSVDYRQSPPDRHPSRGQYLARSVDGGMSFQLFPENPVIPTRNGADYRDPFLIRTDGDYFCAVYERDEAERNCVQFYRSDDLVHWEMSGRADNLYECPNLFPMHVEGTDEIKWVLFGADGVARFGAFDGAFHQEGAAHPLDYGMSTYAGQVWTDAPDGPVHIGWMQGMGERKDWGGDMGYHGQPFSQCMTVPCRLTLLRDRDGLRLTRNPIAALNNLRTGEPDVREYTVEGGTTTIPFVAGCDAEFIVSADGPFDIALDGQTIHCDPARSIVSFVTGSVAVSMAEGLKMRVLIDRTTVELFFGGCATASYALDTRDFALSFTCATRADIHLCAWKMSSALPL
jgi:fructan beta-fructosidase